MLYMFTYMLGWEKSAVGIEGSHLGVSAATSKYGPVLRRDEIVWDSNRPAVV